MQSQFQAQKSGSWPDGTVVNPFTVDYMILAGGGGGAGQITGGGGGGGLVYSYGNPNAAGIDFDTGVYDITVGAGGSGGTGAIATSSNGVNSSIINQPGAIATISRTATGGGSVGCAPGPGPHGTPGGC